MFQFKFAKVEAAVPRPWYFPIRELVLIAKRTPNVSHAFDSRLNAGVCDIQGVPFVIITIRKALSNTTRSVLHELPTFFAEGMEEENGS